MWINGVNGPVNLDQVVRIVVQTNGDADCYTDSTNHFTVTGIGSNAADTKRALQRVVESVDASTYV